MSDYSLVEKIKSLQGKFDSLSAQIADPDVMSDMKRYVQLNKELAPIIETGKVFCKMVQDLDDAKEILQNEKECLSHKSQRSDADPDLRRENGP